MSFDVLQRIAVRVVAVGLAAVSLGESDAACERAAAARVAKDAVPACRAAYRHDGTPYHGIALARGLLGLDQVDEATALARGLRSTPRFADAFAVLGDAAMRRADSTAAVVNYQCALAGHHSQGNLGAAARDAHCLAGAWLQLGELGHAGRLEQIAASLAAVARDERMAMYARLGHAQILKVYREFTRAEAELAAALSSARSDADRRWVTLEQGLLYTVMGQHTLARRLLERVLAQPDTTPTFAIAAHLNLSWIARNTGDPAAALAHVDAAEKLGCEDMDLHLNRGLALADAGRSVDAARELDLAQAAHPQGQWSWWVPYNRGRIAAVLGDPEAERAAYARAIDAIRRLSSSAGSDGPGLIASHRQPYLRLLGVHARAGRWRDALEVVMALDADALITSERDPLGMPVDETARAVPRSTVALPAVEAVLAAWRGRRLVVMVSDEDRMWRLELRDGEIAGADVGAAPAIEELARKLDADPAAAEVAAALGRAIVPGDARGALDLLLVGPIARAPIAALSHADRADRADPAGAAGRADRTAPLVIAHTALARVLHVLPRGPVGGPRRGAVVIGDPGDNLPSARGEAVAVAERMHVTAQLGGSVASTALSGARGGSLLHLAMHAELQGDGPVLRFADRAVGTADIAAMLPAPRVVVLASCGGSAARDDAGWGSLAAAFLTAGSEVVIASPWTVDDAATQRLVLAFYAALDRDGAIGDPVAALAAAQNALHGAPVREWAGFTALRAPP